MKINLDFFLLRQKVKFDKICCVVLRMRRKKLRNTSKFRWDRLFICPRSICVHFYTRNCLSLSLAWLLTFCSIAIPFPLCSWRLLFSIIKLMFIFFSASRYLIKIIFFFSMQFYIFQLTSSHIYFYTIRTFFFKFWTNNIFFILFLLLLLFPASKKTTAANSDHVE